MSVPKAAPLVRLATLQDVEGVHALLCAWEQEGIALVEVARPVATIADWLGPLFWVAEADGKLIGVIAGVVQISDERTKADFALGTKFWSIEDLYISPEWRGKGVGSKLLFEVTEAAEKMGVRASLLYTAPRDWQRVVRFYERHGYRVGYFQMFKPEKSESRS